MEPPRVEPPPPSAPPAAPFEPTARPKAGGCPKPLLVGCLVLVILVGVGVIGLLFFAVKNFGKLMQVYLQESETAIVSKLSPDVTPAERQRLQTAFASARRRIAASKSPQDTAASAQGLVFKLRELTSQEKIRRQDVQELTQMLEDFAGHSSGTAPPTPSPSGP